MQHRYHLQPPCSGHTSVLSEGLDSGAVLVARIYRKGKFNKGPLKEDKI